MFNQEHEQDETKREPSPAPSEETLHMLLPTGARPSPDNSVSRRSVEVKEEKKEDKPARPRA